ncbi:hypothetical protein FG386_003206 [Cryptosporidium ryanae]|uniref:uncharacterized protein n=1 Tax=Cryptosporidium ryanae TaxID=515981 RepID=UPI00351A13C9|nr:hypothetical protein FG386_003206 [Cryptosporidium ryanae]
MKESGVAFNNSISDEIEVESWITCSKFSQQGDDYKKISSLFMVDKTYESGVIPTLREKIVESIKKKRRKRKRNIEARTNYNNMVSCNKNALKSRSCSILCDKSRERS